MRLTQLRDFLAVVDSGSIGGAARALGASQPGISKSIKTLESELQVELLRRTTHGALPTEYGNALLARARIAQTELRRAEEEIRRLAGDEQGSVAIGFGPVAAALIVPQAISLFQKDFPGAKIRLLEGLAHITLPLVLDGTLDFAIAPVLTEYRNDPRLKFRPAFHFERIVAGRAGHPYSDRGSLTYFTDANWLSIEPRGTLEKAFSVLRVPYPRSVVQVDSGTAALWLLDATDMLGVLPRPMLSATNARLEEIRTKERFPPFTVGIFSRSDSPLHRTSSALARIVIAIGKRVALRSPR